MQFTYESRSAKKLARALEKFLSTKGVELSHGQALDAVAAMQGYSDWNSLAASLKPEAIDALLGDFEKHHMKYNLDNPYDKEGELRAHTGFALRFPLHPEECSYVRVLDPAGRETSYWVDQEWGAAPAEVMGAMIGALVRNKAIAPRPQKSRSKVELDGPLTIYVRTYCANQHGESPDWAKIVLTQKQLDELLRRKDLVIREKLACVHLWDSPDMWACEVGDGDPSDRTFRMDCGYLAVSESSFWYAARPKHCDYEVETAGIDIPGLLEAIKGPKQARTETYRRESNVLIYRSLAEQDGFIDELVDAGEPMTDFTSKEYDGSYVENHCPECGEYDSECICEDGADSEKENRS